MDYRDIEKVVKEEYGIPNIFERSRKSKIVEARAVYFYLLKNILDMRYLKMAELFGFDHSTIYHNIKRVLYQSSYDSKFQERLEKVENIVKEMKNT